MHAERRTQFLPPAAERDQGVAWGGANALAESVHHHNGGEESPHVPYDEESEPGQGREGVADDGHLLVAPRAIGRNAAEDADQGCRALIQPVDHAEDRRRQVQIEQEVQRQDGADHLGGDVGEQAGQPEHDDGPAHPGRERAPGEQLPAGLQNLAGILDLVHAVPP